MWIEDWKARVTGKESECEGTSYWRGREEQGASAAETPGSQLCFSLVLLNTLTWTQSCKMLAVNHNEQQILVICHLSEHHPIDLCVNIRFPACEEFAVWILSDLFAYSQLLCGQEQVSLCNVPKKLLNTMAHFNPGMNRRQRWIHKYFFHMLCKI